MLQDREGAVEVLYQAKGRAFHEFMDTLRTSVVARIPYSLRNVGAVLIALVIAGVDLFTPPYLMLTGFYFLPIFFSIWFAGRLASLSVLVIATGVAGYESWQLVPDDASPVHKLVELTSFVLIFPVVAGLLEFARNAVTRMQRDARRMAMAASVFESAREGILITDTEGVIIDANDTFAEITGYTREELVGSNPRLLQSGYQAPDFYTKMWQSIRLTGEWEGEIRNRRKCGTIYSEWLKIRAVRDGRGRILSFIGLYSDISPARERQRELERIAHYDALTGLPNRTLLMDRLEQSMIVAARKGYAVAVMTIDLDGFKRINDQYGHSEGDRLLCELSQRVRNGLRDRDLLARVAGDEFIAVLTGLEAPDEAQPALQRLMQVIAEPVQVAGSALALTASVGVAFYPQDGAHGDQLLRHAAQVMLAAKLAGGNRYQLFDAGQNDAVRERHTWIERIKRGFVSDEFELHYQPKVHMCSGRVLGAEALIRWRHPELGVLPPAAFLAHAESDPATSERLAEWVLQRAIQQLADWSRRGVTLGLSINIGARQLQDARFLALLAECLLAHPDIPSGALTLEILETHALDDLDGAIAVMQRCKTLGVRFALDDFGTGYSSLAYLARLDIDELKIDQSFVRNMLDDEADQAIVAGVLGLASVFRREVVAEGVETEAHGIRLLGLGCEVAQGYGVARPMPADAFESWLLQWRPFPSWQREQAGAPS